MRKKVFGVIFILSAMFCFSNGQAQSQNGWPTNLKFDPQNFADVYMAAVELNHRRFDDVDKINIGDTILFPARTIDGAIEYWVAEAPQVHDGKHDCIWRLTERYIAYQLPTQPAVIVLPAVDPLPIPPVAEKEETPSWLWYILFTSIGLVILILCLWLIWRRQEHNRNNPDIFPPVIPGGLSDNDNEAKRRIAERSNLQPNDIVNIQRGILIRHSGVTKVKAMMAFADHGRQMYIRPGERVAKVTMRKNGQEVVEYWRTHCGNRFGVVATGEFNIPDGWEFVENATTPATTASTTAITTTTNDDSSKTMFKNSTKFLNKIVKLAIKRNVKSVNFNANQKEINITIKFK